MAFIDSLTWRFATKVFDTDTQVSEENIQKIIEAACMAPTSYGLQPFHMYVISNNQLREKLRKVSFDQSQVTDASYYIVFTALHDAVARVKEMIDAQTGGDPEKAKKFVGMKEMMESALSTKSAEEQIAWASRQAYIALGFALAAAAELKIDSCPMEGFLPAEYSSLLPISEGESPVVSLAIGYRKADPKRPKFRFSEESLVTRLE